MPHPAWFFAGWGFFLPALPRCDGIPAPDWPGYCAQKPNQPFCLRRLPLQVPAYYFRATSMARLCLVPLIMRCYRADSASSSSPRITSRSRLGGVYANDASVLCGDRVCGGPLDFSQTTRAGSGPSHAVPVPGPFVERFFGLGRARPVAPPFRQRAPGPLLLFSEISCHFFLRQPRFVRVSSCD